MERVLCHTEAMKKKQAGVVFVAVLLIGLSFLAGLICGGDVPGIRFQLQQFILAVLFLVWQVAPHLLGPPLLVLGVVLIFMPVRALLLKSRLMRPQNTG